MQKYLYAPGSLQTSKTDGFVTINGNNLENLTKQKRMSYKYKRMTKQKRMSIHMKLP